MKIVVLYNPVSGSGKARRLGRHVTERLRSAGHNIVRVPTQRADAELWLKPQLQDCEAIVVVGGDGAVRLAATSAAAQGAALYHVPSGTENLFAREFDMDQCLSKLLDALRRFTTTEVDLAEANGVPFVLMASIGFDAEVVHDLAATRGKRISHLTYARPMMRQLFRWRPTELSIEVDDRAIVDQQPGILVIGNSRQYATRLDPAWQADMTDGLLDVVFHPIGGMPGLLRTMAMHAMHRQAQLPLAVYERGRSIRIRSARPVHYQLDGDPPEHVLSGNSADQRIEALSISLLDKKLRVLLPPV